ncbi:hypothetical protein Pan258_45980 [Symmachiella dynata]|uniref:hypothetical protein n=1 Tax=Symmachiella dynata TaxID=2527995 RepID=UPI00118B369F|nr:hypothetical protein [Symmachiella dynata]QDT50519.1 hypothetical protein Pan258_45980 [Symmachiella dynata]
MNKPLFPLGKIVATPGAFEALEESGQQPATFLERHQSGDWGDCGTEDKQENDLSVREGFCIFSVYHTSKGQKIWIITEADRSSTCILLPDEY